MHFLKIAQLIEHKFCIALVYYNLTQYNTIAAIGLYDGINNITICIKRNKYAQENKPINLSVFN